ncbi:MAG: UDP-N-acetylglucosamine 1-carboxyvinyltransferase [Elusimicrobiota bacterium]
MHRIVIHGGKKLRGSARVSGSKNAALPILIATLLTEGKCVIRNIPKLADIDTTILLLRFIGKEIEVRGDTVFVSPKKKLRDTAPYDLVSKMRASVLVMGPLIARLGKVRVSLPGGCAIGPRPIDIHLDAFSKLGVKIDLQAGYVEMRCDKLMGGKIRFRFPSVGATENLLLASVLAEGKTVLENSACEPEITDLADVLNKMGGKITGAGTKKIVVEGVETLGGFVHSVIPDRIETATYLIAAAITKGDITLENTDSRLLQAVIDKLRESGLRINCRDNAISAKWISALKPADVKTNVYPGFPTDVQAQWMALMSIVRGKSVIEETVFENRFIHAVELKRMGANLKIWPHKVAVTGVDSLSGAPVMVSDLRAGAALVLAGLAAKGRTEIHRVYHLDRGYEQLEKKLKKLGADIRRVKD